MTKTHRMGPVRRWFANLIVGDHLALFVPAKYMSKVAGDMMQVPDDILAARTRHMAVLIEQLYEEGAKEIGVWTTTHMTTHSALTLIRAAHECKAGEYTASVRAVTVCDKEIGDWQVKVTKLPANHVWGHKGVAKKWDGDKLVGLSVTYDIPEKKKP